MTLHAALAATEFPAWIRLAHVFNILLLSLLVRSGLEILSSHPKLYWNDHCTPGTEWLRLTRKQMPADQLWTSLDEEEPFSPLIALPGRSRLGLGRHWHFATVMGWILTGALYVLLLATTSEWRRLTPTTLAVFPQAIEQLRAYLTFHLPAEGHPYTAIQQLAYFPVVFVLSPLAIATGVAMSPAVSGRFPWYPRLFGGKQATRSLHFLCLVGFGAFVAVHTLMVVVHGVGHELAMIVLGTAAADQRLAIALALLVLAAIAAIHVAATVLSIRSPRQVQRALGLAFAPVQDALARNLPSRQALSDRDISPHFKVNGYPPAEETYLELLRSDFADWRLEVRGLVIHPLFLSLDDLRRLPRQEQITKHTCIQGWTGVARWEGVPLAAILDRCRPSRQARYAAVWGMDDKSLSGAAGEHGDGYFYEVIDLELARHPQTILAYAMNGEPLPLEHGAPLRLRVESELGFKMVKWVGCIELISDYSTVGGGQGGWREDNMFYSPTVAI